MEFFRKIHATEDLVGLQFSGEDMEYIPHSHDFHIGLIVEEFEPPVHRPAVANCNGSPRVCFHPGRDWRQIAKKKVVVLLH